VGEILRLHQANDKHQLPVTVGQPETDVNLNEEIASDKSAMMMIRIRMFYALELCLDINIIWNTILTDISGYGF
jgi:hypothetical protein